MNERRVIHGDAFEAQKPDARVTITPAGGFCSFHVKDVA